MVLDALVQVVRATGKIGLVGVYEPSNEGAATVDAQQGRYDFDYGTAFTKGITIGTGQCPVNAGQCPVKKYNRWLRDLIIRGRTARFGHGSSRWPSRAATCSSARAVSFSFPSATSPGATPRARATRSPRP
jgi:hypothetical protein